MIVLLDACVLVPLGLREMLLQAARQSLIAPRWSARIEAEWRAACLRRPDAPPAAVVDGDIALANAAFPQARVSGWEALEGPLSLPDWNDRHVLAAAIAAGAQTIVTDNSRDFPRRALAAHGLERETGDGLLWRLAGAQPEAMAAASAAYAAAAGLPDEPAARAAHFKRIRLPRFAKALRRAADGG